MRQQSYGRSSSLHMQRTTFRASKVMRVGVAAPKRSNRKSKSLSFRKSSFRSRIALPVAAAPQLAFAAGALPLFLTALIARAWSLLTSAEGAVLERRYEELSDHSRRMRVAFILSLASLFAVGVTLRLYALQGRQYADWIKLADRQHSAEVEVKGARGSILDRYGRTLSSSVETLSVALHPTQIPQRLREKTAAQLSTVLGTPTAEVSAMLTQPKSFVWLAKGLQPGKRAELEKLRLNGLSYYPEFERYYPQGSLLGPVLGTVGKDGQGLSGVELGFNKYLRAANVEVDVRRDARGRFVTSQAWKEGPTLDGKALANMLMQPAALTAANPAALNAEPAPNEDLRLEGGELVLTIDAMLQSILEEELTAGVRDNKAKRGFGVIIDADSGDILALGQVPSFDPNQKSGLSGDLLRNYLAQDSFEPGSTLKPLVAAMALDQQEVGANEIMDCESGSFRVGKHTIRDVHPVGVVSLRDVLVRSSNICMAKIGARLGAAKLHAALETLGLGATTGAELPGEAKGILRGLDGWKTIDTATASFGQGVAVTGLQLARAYSALANGGVLPELRLIRTEQPKAGKRVMSKETADRIAEFLQGVTEDKAGTAHKARINGVTVSGKTGTAQKPVIGGRGYRSDAVMSSFVGFVNGNALGIQHRLVAYIVVDEPGVYPRWGGAVAAPIFKRAMERALSHLISLQELRTASLSVSRPATRDVKA